MLFILVCGSPLTPLRVILPRQVRTGFRHVIVMDSPFPSPTRWARPSSVFRALCTCRLADEADSLVRRAHQGLFILPSQLPHGCNSFKQSGLDRTISSRMTPTWAAKLFAVSSGESDPADANSARSSRALDDSHDPKYHIGYSACI